MEQCVKKAVRIRLIKIGANALFVILLAVNIFVLNKFAIPISNGRILTWGYIPWWATLIISVALFTGLLGVYYALSLRLNGLLEKDCDPINYYLVSKASVFMFTKEQKNLLEMNASFYSGKFEVAVEKAEELIKTSKKYYYKAIKILAQSYCCTDDLDAIERLIKTFNERVEKNQKKKQLFQKYLELYAEITKGNYFKAKNLIDCVTLNAKTPKDKIKYKKSHTLGAIEWEYACGLIMLKTGDIHAGKTLLKEVEQTANKTFYKEFAKKLLSE